MMTSQTLVSLTPVVPAPWPRPPAPEAAAAPVLSASGVTPGPRAAGPSVSSMLTVRVTKPAPVTRALTPALARVALTPRAQSSTTSPRVSATRDMWEMHSKNVSNVSMKFREIFKN